MKRNTLILIGIIALFAVYLVYRNCKSTTEQPDLPRWEGSADEIMIKRPSGTLALSRKEGKWVVGSELYPADRSAIEGIEKTIRELKVVDLISEKGIYATYDLTPDKYTEVIVRKDNAVVRHLMFGKKSSSSQHTYMRVGSEKGVYMASGSFDSILDSTVESLRDKEIVKFAKSDVTKLEIQYKGSVFAFERETQKDKDAKDSKEAKGKDADKKKKTLSRWVLRGKESVKLSRERMNSFLSLFDPLRATGFPDVKKEMLRSPLVHVTIKGLNKEISFDIFKKESEYLVVSSESPFVFSISEWSAKRFMMEKTNDLEGIEE